MKRVFDSKIPRFVFKYIGSAAIPVYAAFTFISHLYNKRINPLCNWLSDYGNPLVNPHGAVYYNNGCRATALLLAVFYIGLFTWYGGGRAARKFHISYAVAQISGLAGSVLLIMTTVFPLGTNTQLHSAFSTANMVAMSNFLAFTATGFVMNRKIPKTVAVFGFFAAAFNIVTMNAFENFYISEWIFFLLFAIYIILITFYYDRIAMHGDKK